MFHQFRAGQIRVPLIRFEVFTGALFQLIVVAVQGIEALQKCFFPIKNLHMAFVAVSTDDLVQIRSAVLDLFLVWCLLKPSQPLSADEIARNRHNLTQVVQEGRRPGLMLHDGHEALTLRQWGEQLFDELAQVAQLLDRAYGRVQYQVTLQAQREKLIDPTQTLSARLLDHLLKQDLEYVIKKLDLTPEEFDQIMKAPIKSYSDYPNNEKLLKFIYSVYYKIKGIR